MANYSYPLPMPDPPPSTTRPDRTKPTSSRALLTNPSTRPRASKSFMVGSGTEDPKIGHGRRDSRFDDAFEEAWDVGSNGEERGGGKVETMRDFLVADEGFQPRRRALGVVEGNIARSQVTDNTNSRTAVSPKSSIRGRTPNRLRKVASPVGIKGGKSLIPLRVGNALINDDSSENLRDQFGNPRRPIEAHHQGTHILNSRIERSRIQDVAVVGKKKSILDFAAHLANKPKPAPSATAIVATEDSSGTTKPRAVFPKFSRRKPVPSPHDAPPPTASTPDESTVRESIDSSYSIISEPDASFGLPADESMWGEQDGGVSGRRVGKKKSFAAAGGIFGKIFGGGEVLKELRHEESTATLRPVKTATQSLRGETRPGTVNPRDEPTEPTSPTSSIESFQSRFPDHPHERNFPPTSTQSSNPGQDPARVKSPALPTFHFTRPSYSGTNFRVDLGDLAADIPPVPPVPATFSKAATARRDTTSEEMTNHPAQEYSQTSNEDSGGSSLVHVEGALGGDEDYSLISGTSVFRDREGRRHSGKLPWRRSIQGVFTDGGDVAGGIEQGKLCDGLSSVPAREKRPSVMNLEKVSNVTGTLQAFLDTYATSPSVLGDFATSPTKQTETLRLSAPGDLSAKLDSPSPSQILEHDSPTPMRKYARHPYSRSLRAPQKIAASPTKVSPLRLALNHSLAKSQKSNGGPAQKIFDDNPFLESKKSPPQNGFMSRLRKDSSTFGPSLALNRFLEDSTFDASSEYTDSQASGPAFLAVGEPGRDRGCSTATQDTASSADQDDQLRGSFDFTGEYRALNENGTRQSFVDELERFGLDVGGESFRIENFLPECEQSAPIGVAKESRDIDSGREPAKRNAYGFIENFKFGTSPSVPSTTTGAFDANLTSSSSSPPREPLPIPQGNPYSAGNSRFKENSGNVSRFSISTMSSLGVVVDTGIAGADFVNVFEREFGALLDGRDMSVSSDNLGSFDISGEQHHSRLRRPFHARISSFASDTSQKGRTLQSFPLIHERQESSPDVKSSAGRQLGDRKADGDNIIKTECHTHTAASYAPRPLLKYSKDSLLDSSYHLSTKDSILNSLPEITEDSVFQSGSRRAKEDSFTINPILETLGGDPPEYKGTDSPLATKKKTNARSKLNDSTKPADQPDALKDAEEEAADIEKYLLRADVEESVDDVSFRSVTKTASDGVQILRKPSRNSRSRPSSFLLGNSGTLPALSSSARSETSSRLSADVHSIISLMLDSGPESRTKWSRHLKGLSQLSQVAPPIEEERLDAESHGKALDASVPVGKRSVAIGSTAPLALNRWADLQRLADEELLKSRSAWQDTMKSIEAVTEFKPPTTATGIRALLRNSIDLHQPLSEISPGTQVVRRENFLAEQVVKAHAEPSESPNKSGNRLSALPTKYMLADAGATTSPGRSADGDKTEQRLSAVFAKFAVPANLPAKTELGLATGAARSMIPKRINVAAESRAEQGVKLTYDSRQRVSSTIRREKMGWTRRKDITALSPLGARRISKRSSRAGVQDNEKENATQASQKKKRASGYKPTRKPSHKALRI